MGNEYLNGTSMCYSEKYMEGEAIGVVAWGYIDEATKLLIQGRIFRGLMSN